MHNAHHRNNAILILFDNFEHQKLIINFKLPIFIGKKGRIFVQFVFEFHNTLIQNLNDVFLVKKRQIIFRMNIDWIYVTIQNFDVVLKISFIFSLNNLPTGFRELLNDDGSFIP
ncbi:hypothetical protein BpHYR1_042321 [Brachionus plicatilis]|uniref:Uncharacterized protein n=1 Tax=Brachionus plicatilis TaxID=10195 RepID=A0A3M7PRL0_BRAPC|nr:hypothetical protein BpHYR1_042321 [Brachionus plicatilis]